MIKPATRFLNENGAEMINLRKKCGLGVFVPQDFFILKREKAKEKKEITINYDISEIDADWLQQLRKKGYRKPDLKH